MTKSVVECNKGFGRCNLLPGRVSVGSQLTLYVARQSRCKVIGGMDGGGAIGPRLKNKDRATEECCNNGNQFHPSPRPKLSKLVEVVLPGQRRRLQIGRKI